MIRRSSSSSSSRTYVCWRCLAARPAERTFFPQRHVPSSSSSLPSPSTAAAFSSLSTSTPTTRLRLLSQTLARHGRPSLRSVSTDSPATETPPGPPTADDLTLGWSQQFKTLRSPSEPSSIRERLKLWEAQNPTPALAIPADVPADGVGNVLTKNRSEFGFRLDLATEDDDATRPHFDGVDMVDVGLSGSVLEAGDLVEVSSGSWKLRLLAICLGDFNGHLHFYTNTGKWFTTRTIRSGFVVKRFVQDPAELRAVIDAIPSLSPSSTVLNELQDLNVGPSRDIAASLIRKMYRFQSEARNIHQTYVERLSRAHTQLGAEERILSLREIAQALLPPSLKRNKGAFPPEALYAVYSVIEEEDVAFRVLDRGARHHESYTFALQSAEVQENVAQVEHMVREYYELMSSQSRTAKRKAASGTPAAFTRFLEQARELIDQVRQERQWSPHGMIGPHKTTETQLDASKIPAWSETGLTLIKFIQHWAASGGFRLGSRCHWIGASILRLVRRYDDVLLDGTTGWTFLQEIGWIPPWDISARHELRLPEQQVHRHTAVLPPPELDATPLELGPDKLAHLRQDFARSTIYCIDAADTLDVDDGVSLEAAGSGEYWIHVHVADPASRIAPNSELGRQAALTAQTTYLAGFNKPMLDHKDVRETFSLGPNRSALTFSALVDESGRLLDSKVTPGVLRDVVYITPEDVDEVVGSAASQGVPPDVFEVGTPPANDPPPTRRMTTPKGLSRAQKRDLATLAKLADALQRVRIEKGAIPAYLPRLKATVSMDGVVPEATGSGSVFYRGDPYIRLAYEGQGNAMVSSVMQLAGEIAARWCYERDIPVPYRVQLLTGSNMEALRAFNRDVFYPQLAAGKNPPPEHWHTLMSLVGGFDTSTNPGPNSAMGLDLYTKVTSPLRRYLDLLVHWQIEAALREEHRTGKSLVVRPSPGRASETAPAESAPAAKKESRTFLPFSKQELEDVVLPRMRIRERHSKLLDNVDGNSQWILQALVRGWRFGEASPATPLPATFRFTVSEVASRRGLKGQIDWFDRLATVELEDMNGVARLNEVAPGDVFEVELADVNVHTNKIHVRLLKRVSKE